CESVIAAHVHHLEEAILFLALDEAGC
ncbi:unnamed protein product, partial [Urochloa humidicola]